MFKRNAVQNGKWLTGRSSRTGGEVAKENLMSLHCNFILAEYIHIVPLSQVKARENR